jgi:hypothetical protein
VKSPRALAPTDNAMALLSHQGNKFRQVLGTAVAALWAELPQAVQEKVFEHAVVAGQQAERDESLRQELARFCTTNMRGSRE